MYLGMEESSIHVAFDMVPNDTDFIFCLRDKHRTRPFHSTCAIIIRVSWVRLMSDESSLMTFITTGDELLHGIYTVQLCIFASML